ncbi:MAG: hypothetical protein HY519_01815 [Candidatus Aenigmarchaeota archaeon]|nr:hypothetical protein [Candidatus Aenigmarchaeota archaeon]
MVRKKLALLVAAVIGIVLIQSFAIDAQENLPQRVADGITNIVSGIFSSTGIDVCAKLNFQQINYDEFLQLLQAMRAGNCKESFITLDFGIDSSGLQEAGQRTGFAAAFFDRQKRSYGGNLLVGVSPTNSFRIGDSIKLSVQGADGTREQDVIAEITLRGCNPSPDSVCDVGCAFKPGICDPDCKPDDQNNLAGICDIDCVDRNQDGKVNSGDLQPAKGCFYDCYNQFSDPNRAYDPNCVERFGNTLDGICDPDSSAIEDGVCDLDCGQTDGICDPECSGDLDCAACDGIANGVCLPKCKADASYPENDVDCKVACAGTQECPSVDRNFFWPNDTICNQDRGERCDSPDCPAAGSTCESLSGGARTCLPAAPDADDFGCAATNRSQGEVCFDTRQCQQSLFCSTGRCCPRGTIWDGQQCQATEILDWVFVPIGVGADQEGVYRKQIDDAFSVFVRDSPLNKCSNLDLAAKKYVIKPGVCQTTTCRDLCSDCINVGRECLKLANLDGEKCQQGETCLDKVYDLFSVIVPKGGSLYGCAGAIPNDGSANHLNAQIGAGTIVHETGHDFGLYHLTNPEPICILPSGPCQGANAKDCNKGRLHMTYCMTERTGFGDYGYYYMENGIDKDGKQYFSGYKSMSKFLAACK